MTREDFLEEATFKPTPCFIHLFIHPFGQSRLYSWKEQEIEGPVLNQDLGRETTGGRIITTQWETWW